MRVNALTTGASASKEHPGTSAHFPQLAWGNGQEVFALRLRQSPPQPPERLFAFIEAPNPRNLSHTTLKVIDALLIGDLSRIRSDTFVRQPANQPNYPQAPFTSRFIDLPANPRRRSALSL
jgi:hypothetical protein